LLRAQSFTTQEGQPYPHKEYGAEKGQGGRPGRAGRDPSEGDEEQRGSDAAEDSPPTIALAAEPVSENEAGGDEANEPDASSHEVQCAMPANLADPIRAARREPQRWVRGEETGTHKAQAVDGE
jgi:hypothetical protein